MDKENKTREIVKQKFTDYLTTHNFRKTPERYAILDLIYTEPKHFDMETLYSEMKSRNFRVSRATLYNTMLLLQECKLVLKHQFGKNISYYERAYNNDIHHHLICTSCGSIQEYRDVELRDAIQTRKIKKFTPTLYSLYIYGFCSDCAKKMKSQNNKRK